MVKRVADKGMDVGSSPTPAIECIEAEEWSPIKFMENYEVSTFGRVRSVKIITIEDQGGIAVINYRKGAVRKAVRLKRIVADTFCDADNIDTRLIVHIDGDPMNCHVNNLAYEQEL